MAFEAGTVVARLELVGQGFAQGIRKAEQATEGLRTGLDRVSQSFGRIAAVSGAAFAAMSAGLALAARTGAKFEESMINVGAVTGATGERLKELSAIAVQTGEATIFSASQVGEAMFNLGSQGVKTAKQFKDVLAPSLDLAAATQSDVNFASRALLASIRAFGAPLSDAAKFANIFSAANENSALTAEILDRALRPVGATAAALGISFEETTAILGGLVNAGLTAERAGTGLKTALALLLKPSGEATKELNKLGIAQRDIARLIKDPIKLFKLFAQRGLNAAQAFKIFGTEGGPAVLALAKQIPAIEKLNIAITGTNSATRIAAVQLAATTAKAKLFGSAIDSAAIALFESLQPGINVVIKAATEVVRKLAAWIRENKKLTAGVAIAVTALTGAVAVLTGLVAAAAAAGAAIIGLKISFAGFGATLPGVTKKMALARTGALGLGKALGAAGLAFTIGFTLGKVIDKFIREIFPGFSKWINQVIGEVLGLNEEMQKVTGTAADFASRVKQAGDALIKKNLPAITSNRKAFQTLNAALREAGLNFKILPKPIKELFSDFRTGTITAEQFALGLDKIGQGAQRAAEGRRRIGEEGLSPEEQQAELDRQEQFITAGLSFMDQRIEGGKVILDQKEEELAKELTLIEKIGEAVNLEGQLGTAIEGVLAGTRGVNESLGNMIKGIGKAIVKALILKAAMAGIKAVTKAGPLGFVGKLLGFKEGGIIGAQVGLLPAGEDRLIAVQSGESVLNRDATAALGREGINALNRGGAGRTTVINIKQTFKAPLGFTAEGLEALRQANDRLRLQFQGGV